MNQSDQVSFNSDIDAALAAGVPIELETRLLVQPYKKPTSPAMDSSGNNERRHQAAIECLRKLCTMLPVFEGLSSRAIAVRRFTSIIRRTAWYLATLLFLAFVGLLHFRFYTMPSYQLVREDMNKVYGIQEFSFDTFPYTDPAIAVIGCLLVAVVIAIFANRYGLFLSFFGGRDFVRAFVLSSAADAVYLLRKRGLSFEESNDLTAQLFSLDSEGKSQLSVSLGEHSSDDSCRTFSHYWSAIAESKYKYANVVLPFSVLITAGGLVLLLYGVLLYGPLVGLLYDTIEAHQS